MKMQQSLRKGKCFLAMLLTVSIIAGFIPTVSAYSAPILAEQETAVDDTTKEKNVDQTNLSLDAPSYLLMEETTGRVICEKQPDEKRSPASITKIMTLILIFDALKAGKIKMTDEVTTSAHAKSMGGSQVFLEEGETQTVETMIKCIVIASGNDASVAMAEYIGGSEEAFVKMMNERAKGLGMTETNFIDCCGLTEDENHYSSSKDVAIMARELSFQYPKIHEYASIWMEDITHVTKQGSKQFTLTNTNKLIRHYQGATGLKTGSTSKAKFCLAATATRNDIQLIAVVMGCPDSKARVRDASKLLDYGFANCTIYEDKDTIAQLPKVPVRGGMEKAVSVEAKEPFRYVFINGKQGEITHTINWKGKLKAPVKKGDKVGVIRYSENGKEIGSIPLTASETVGKMTYKLSFIRIVEQYLTL